MPTKVAKVKPETKVIPLLTELDEIYATVRNYKLNTVPEYFKKIFANYKETEVVIGENITFKIKTINHKNMDRLLKENGFYKANGLYKSAGQNTSISIKVTEVDDVTNLVIFVE